MVPKSKSAYIRINVSSCVLCANLVCLPAWTHVLFRFLNNAPIPPEVSLSLSWPLFSLSAEGRVAGGCEPCVLLAKSILGNSGYSLQAWTSFRMKHGYAVCLWLLYGSDVFGGISHCLLSPLMHVCVCVCDWNDLFSICVNNIILN